MANVITFIMGLVFTGFFLRSSVFTVPELVASLLDRYV